MIPLNKTDAAESGKPKETFPLTEILEKINIPCEDDRHGFTDSRKSDRIDKLLRNSPFRKLHDGRLTKIYAQKPETAMSGKNCIVVSSHIDTVYRNFYFREGKDVIIGTLDNSITNAVLIRLALKRRLPSNTILAFTGNEEKDSLGVDETVGYLAGIRSGVDAAISLDITDRGFRNHGYTIENYFIRKGEGRTFFSKKQFMRYLVRLLENRKVKTIHHVAAAPDDTWQFDEHDLNCFSFCLPSRSIAVHDDWMHDDIGVIVRRSALKEFEAGLLKLIRRLSGNE
ncbi:MAG: M28 family peptidase [Ignavibacteria bacterium]|nr:M28 family peptidase [Ignavibacteria bacterium]